MGRSDEQKAADEALTAAIQQVRTAYYPDEGDPGILTDYYVMSAWQGWSEEGEGFTSMMSTPRDGDLPLYRILGLLDYGLAAAEGDVMGIPEGDEE
jgi:hypothetical protein